MLNLVLRVAHRQSSSEKRSLSNTCVQDNSPDGQVKPKQAIFDISSAISSRVDIHANQSNDIAKMLEDMHIRFNSPDKNLILNRPLYCRRL